MLPAPAMVGFGAALAAVVAHSVPLKLPHDSLPPGNHLHASPQLRVQLHQDGAFGLQRCREWIVPATLSRLGVYVALRSPIWRTLAPLVDDCGRATL